MENKLIYMNVLLDKFMWMFHWTNTTHLEVYNPGQESMERNIRQHSEWTCSLKYVFYILNINSFQELGEGQH